jgi:hypothetical protein
MRTVHSLRRLAALAVAVSALATAAPSMAAAPQPRVTGNKLTDTATGATFVPRGVNWPSFEYACFYGYGYSNERSATSVGPDDEDAADIAAWHFNTVRIPLNQDCWLGDDGLPKSEPGVPRTADGYRQAVQNWVAILHQHGLAVVLDLHWTGPDGVGAEGQRAMTDDRSDAFWASVGATFASDPAVMFDAFNEPYSRFDDDVLTFDLTWGCWRNGGCQAPAVNESQSLDGKKYRVMGMQGLVDAIRNAGATQPILLGGRNYANDLGQWLASRPSDGDPNTTADDQLVASFHNYPGQGCDTVACWSSDIAAVAAEVPVVTTEFGQDDCKATHVTSYMNWADQHGVGYLAWQWVIPDDGVVCGEPSAYSLIADPNGTPQAPVGTAIKDHLAALPGLTSLHLPDLPGVRSFPRGGAYPFRAAHPRRRGGARRAERPATSATAWRMSSSRARAASGPRPL